jgi:CDP-diacylglycerol--glycerol-3-phosphate 3-phosphatidyltransferase
MLKKMNLPNKLTCLRIILVPVFVIFLCLPQDFKWPNYVALGIFVVAAITDYLDGIISRKKGLITNFGKIMDPLADKMLISAAFIMLTGLGVIPAYITAIIVLRDFFANSIRMFGANTDTTIAAVLSGKIKTFSQMLGLVLALVGLAFSKYAVFAECFGSYSKMNGFALALNVLMTVTITLAVVATLWSLVDYIIKFKKHINVEK